MKKVAAICLSVMLLSAVALADVDLSAMSVDELAQLQRSVGQEIAARVADDAQTVTVDGVIFRLLLVEVGQAREDMPGLGVVLLASNTSDASMTPLYDLGVTVTHGGRPLETSWVKSDHFTSSTVNTSQTAVIAPGVVDMQVFLGFILAGEGGRVEITLSRKHTRINEDPYCGTFVADISGLL